MLNRKTEAYGERRQDGRMAGRQDAGGVAKCPGAGAGGIIGWAAWSIGALKTF